MSERLSNNEKRGQSSEELKELREQQQERLKENVERRAEKEGRGPEDSPEKARERALELAEKRQEVHKDSEPVEKSPEREVPTSRKARDKQFERTMTEVRRDMSPASRTFSKVIHNPVVERVSDVAGNTVARPNAVLGGSFTAFVVVLLTYLVARHYGYPLSGSETLIAFSGGWVLGILFDYLRVMISGRRS